MNPRLTKELRPLLLPWALATVAGAGHLLARPNSPLFHGALGDFVSGLAGLAFVVGVLVLAAMPMGAELHDRTLALLFSQPLERERLWKEKLFAASLMVAALVIVHGLATVAMGRLNFTFALLYLAFAVTAICSVGYHTMATRSVLVGIASAVGMPYVITLTAYLIVRYLLGVELHLSDQEALTLIIIAAGVYSIFSLWLSRRQFVNLELKDGVASRAAEVPALLVPKTLSTLFRARPTGVTLNLIRKEVCLHKPLFLVSAIVTTVWLLTLLLMLLRPEWHDGCTATLNGLTATQFVLIAILGGCVALGDDKALGTSTWHLALPVSARRQWFIKCATALGITFVVGVILPTALAALTLVKANVGFLAARPIDLPVPITVFLAVFILSFWSGSMTTNTVRGALTTILTIVILAFAIALGISSAAKVGGIQSLVLPTLIAKYQWSPYSLDTVIPIEVITVGLVMLGILVALHQSYLMFRQTARRLRTVLRCYAVLASVTFGMAFWQHDLQISMKNQRYRFVQSEVANAFRNATLQGDQLAEGETRTLDVRELIKDQQLSDRAKYWIRNSEATLHWNKGTKNRVAEKWYVCELKLPGGTIVPLIWTVPDSLPNQNP